MSVSPPEGFGAREVLAVAALFLGGTLGDVEGDPAWKVRNSIVLAEFDDRADVYGMFPIVVSIYDLDFAAAGALARDLSAELTKHDGWQADPDPAAYRAEHHAQLT